MDTLALILSIIGSINWGLVGIFQFDLVAWLFGGQGSVISRIIYTVIGLAGLWCITLLFRKGQRIAEPSAAFYAAQPLKFAHVGRDDHIACGLFEYSHLVGNGPEGVGIQQQRALKATHQLLYKSSYPFAPAHAGAQRQQHPAGDRKGKKPDPGRAQHEAQPLPEGARIGGHFGAVRHAIS